MANYRRMFDDLAKLAARHGIKIKMRRRGELRDYVGMNWEFAKAIGYKMPARTIEIDANKRIKVRYHTLHHEIDEAGLIQKGSPCWKAHLQALKDETKGPLAITWPRSQIVKIPKGATLALGCPRAIPSQRRRILIRG